MKKKLLGVGFIVFDLLVIVYHIRMTYGWQEVWRIIGATGQILGILLLVVLFIVGGILLLNDPDNENFYDL